VLRGVMWRIANGGSWTMPATIDDPAMLGEIAESPASLGLPPPQGKSDP